MLQHPTISKWLEELIWGLCYTRFRALETELSRLHRWSVANCIHFIMGECMGVHTTSAGARWEWLTGKYAGVGTVIDHVRWLFIWSQIIGVIQKALFTLNQFKFFSGGSDSDLSLKGPQKEFIALETQLITTGSWLWTCIAWTTGGFGGLYDPITYPEKVGLL